MRKILFLAILLLVESTNGSVVQDCTSHIVFRNLRHENTFLPMTIPGVNRNNLSDVSKFIDKISVETGFTQQEIVQYIKVLEDNRQLAFNSSEQFKESIQRIHNIFKQQSVPTPNPGAKVGNVSSPLRRELPR